MWARFVSEDYISKAPREFAGVKDFDQRPEIMIQLDYYPVIEISGTGIVKYKLEDNKIIKYYIDVPEKKSKTKKEKILEKRDSILKMFEIENKSKAHDLNNKSKYFIPFEDEDEVINAYKEYLMNIESEPGFPDVKLKELKDFYKS